MAYIPPLKFPALLATIRMDPNPVLERVRNDAFYLDYDPMVIFLVEDQLFRVHRHFFIQGSKFFRDMFSLNVGEENAEEGASDARPIILPNVTIKEFRALLRFFYATSLSLSNKNTPAEILAHDLDEKLDLLNIAHRFTFDGIFDYMLRQIDPGEIPVVNRIRLADKFGLTEWLSSAYQAILERSPEKKISDEEAITLGLQRLVTLYEAKNSMYHRVKGSPPPRRRVYPGRLSHCQLEE